MSEAHSTGSPDHPMNGVVSPVGELRDLLVARLGHAIHRMMEKVDDALFELAEKSENIQNQSLYFDAMREVRLKRASIEDGFRSSFRAAFDAKLSSSGSASAAGKVDDPSMEWGLVDHEAVEEQIAVNNLADKVTHGCREELYALDQRLRALLKIDAQTEWSQPASPEVVCESIRRALTDLQSGLKVRLIILKLFDRYVAGELAVIYHDCNEWLIGKGILPELRTQLRSPRSGRALLPQSAGDAAPAGESPVMDDATLVQSLRALLLGEALPGGATAFGAGTAAGAGSLRGLTALQRGDGTSWGNAVADPVAWSEGLRGEVNILRSLKGIELTSAFGPLGDLTIDIVAMLFDYILDDRSIPSPLRALIGRLQIPIVKVALLDTSFFARKSHPARRLLNTLAEAAAGATSTPDESDPLYAMMEGLITRVNREFEQDIGIFSELLEAFERFLVEEGERRQLRSERTRKVIGAGSATASLEEEISRLLDERIVGTTLNECVRGFLGDQWRTLLHSLSLQHGSGPGPFRDAIGTMDELIASVQPKHTPEERRRLSTTLPALLARLKAGMERIEVPAANRKRFLSELARVHSDAVRGRDTAGAVPASAQGSVVNNELPAAPHPVLPSEPEPSPAIRSTGDDAPAESLSTVRSAPSPEEFEAITAGIDPRESDTIERLHAPVIRRVDRDRQQSAEPMTGRADSSGTVLSLDPAQRHSRRVSEEPGRGAGESAAILPLRRASEGDGTGAVKLPDGPEHAPAFEPPAEIAERTSPREQLADVLRTRLLQTGEVSLSELIDPSMIEERLARTQPLEPFSVEQAEIALERTQPDVRESRVGSLGHGPEANADSAGTFNDMGQLSGSELMELMASGALQFEEVTLADPVEAGRGCLPTDDVHARRVAALETGTWLEFTEEDGSRRQARLTWINSSTDTFMFTDRRGLKVADRTRNGLIADFRRGSAQIVEQSGGFDHWMGKLMDGLGRAMQR